MKMRRIGARVCLVMSLSFVLWMPRLWGQTVTGTLQGQITDASGAVIPGATVVIRNHATGTQRVVTTNSNGNYIATLLPTGVYRITIKAHGFQSYVAHGVTLTLGQHRAVNARLRPGALTQTVNVTSSTVAVQTQSAAQSQTITGRQARNLELDNRNFEQLVALQPGVASTQGTIVGFGLQNVTALSVNGTRPSASNWTVDGADVNDSGSNFTLLDVPSVDAIREVKIERSSYDAEYGRSGGGQIQVVTRSGGNQFHGDAYEFVRNDALNANNFFNNANGVKRPPVRYNDFGYTIGGPIVKNKTFFFFSQEFRRTSLPANHVFYLPNPQELSGNFNGLMNAQGKPVVLNPAMAPAGCIAGDQINCISPNAQAYVKNVYAQFRPNSTCTTQLTCTLSEPLNSTANYRQEILRIDQSISSNVQLFGRYMDDSTPTTYPLGIWGGSNLPGIANSNVNSLGRNLVLHLTEEFTPTIANEMAFNYSWGGINIVNVGPSASVASFPGVNFSQLPYSDPYNRVPTSSISGLTGPVGGSNAPYHERNIDENFYDNLSIIHGNHSIRTGLTLQWMTKSENAASGDAGFGFNAANGNPAFANFLLGEASSFGQASRDIIPHLHYLNFEAYVQDDWRVSPNLTLNLGVRYSYFPTPYDSTGILDNFDPAVFNFAQARGLINPATGAFNPGPFTPANYLNGIIVGGHNSPYGAQVNPDYKTDFAPRLGFSWDPTGAGQMAIRGGYGVFYDRTLNGIWEQNQFTNPPFVSSLNESNPSNADLFDNPNSGTVRVNTFPLVLVATGNPQFKVPMIQDWNLSVEREILHNTLLQVAYVGTRGTHLLGSIDLNQAPLSTRRANPTAQLNAVRPYAGFASIHDRVPEFSSIYNSLQVSLNRRVRAGLNLGLAYTWSRNLTNNSADRNSPIQNTYNPQGDYGPAFFSRDQVLTFNYIYDLPFFAHARGLASALGGWEISGITTYETGTPLTVYQFNDPFNCYDWSGGCGAPQPGTYPGGIGIDPSSISPRPDMVGNVNGPKTIKQWFNINAFSDAIGHFGSSGRGVLYAPGYVDWDFALLKNFQIGERFRTQIRGEFFNLFNHTNLGSPVTYTDYGPSIFGHIYSARAARQIQLGIKFMF